MAAFCSDVQTSDAAMKKQREREHRALFDYARHRRTQFAESGSNASVLDIADVVRKEWDAMKDDEKDKWRDRTPRRLELCRRCRITKPIAKPMFDSKDEADFSMRYNPAIISSSLAAEQGLCTLCWAQRLRHENGAPCEVCGSSDTDCVKCSVCSFAGQMPAVRWCYPHKCCVAHCTGCVGWNQVLCVSCFMNNECLD